MKNFLAVMLGITTVMSAIGQEAASGLVIKSKAPDFTAKDHEGNTVNLSELQKKARL